MKYGVREICNVVFKAKADMKIGTATFKKGQPVLYIDTAKTSTTEGAATTVYATGGRGNTRLIAWEGERTLTFTVEDALLSPISFAMLSGAGVLKGANNSTAKVHIHTTTQTNISVTGTTATIDLTDALLTNDELCDEAPVFITTVEADGSLTGEILTGFTASGKTFVKADADSSLAGKSVFVDYYITRLSNRVNELQIDGAHFGGYFYVEANTLWRDTDGSDHAAEMTFPNVKIQSNFTFNNAATGDPSTFTFTMDAFPGYTWFNKNKKVLLAMQIMDDAEGAADTWESVFAHTDDEKIDEYDENENLLYFDDSVAKTTTPVAVTGLTADPATLTLQADGDAGSFAIAVAPADATDKTIKYTMTGSGVTLYTDAACTSALTLNTAVANTTIYVKPGAAAASDITITATSNADATKTATVGVTVTA